MASYDDTATVSGSVVSFSDGADEVPIKSWEVEIAPTLTGKSAIECTQTGKNQLNYIDYSNSYGITSVTDNGSGSFTVVASVLGAYIDHIIKVKAGETYVIKCTSATNDDGNASQIGVVNVYDGSDDTATLLLNGASINYSQKTFVPTGNYILVRNKVTGGSGAGTGTIVEPQLEVGSTAHAYEPYQTPTHYTAQLGRTIYGGTADVVNGTGTETHQQIDLGDLRWVYANAQNRFYANLHLSGIETDFPTNANDVADIVCGDYETITFSKLTNDASLNNKIAGITTDAPFITIRDTRYTDATSFKAALQGKKMIIPLATPTDFTFTPITPTPETALGVNNFWADTGDTEVTYYKSGYGFTSVTVHKETPEGEPVVQTAKFHRIVYEGEVDAVKGTGKVSIGESGTEYDPPETFTFEPISISTDEGENTLFANEGDSAITYRKAVD